MGERRGTKGLELWCRRMTEGYPGVEVNNMTTSWRDGLAFCAIIHHFRPDLIDFAKLNKDDIYYNNDLAFQVAETHLGIPALLEPEDMVEFPVPDRLSILTYLSQFYRTFGVAQGSPARIVPKRPANASDRGVVSPTSTSPTSKMPRPSGGRSRREPCAKCGLPVFIAERLNVGKQLYHRTCFRCARCNSQLTLANYYETETNQYCCETCPDEEQIKQNEKDLIEKSVLSRSLSDEEKSAGIQKFEGQDDYSYMFETALEYPDDQNLKKNSTLSSEQSAEYTKARSRFITSQLAESEDDSSEDEVPDLPTSEPPSLPKSDPPGSPKSEPPKLPKYDLPYLSKSTWTNTPKREPGLPKTALPSLPKSEPPGSTKGEPPDAGDFIAETDLIFVDSQKYVDSENIQHNVENSEDTQPVEKLKDLSENISSIVSSESFDSGCPSNTQSLDSLVHSSAKISVISDRNQQETANKQLDTNKFVTKENKFPRGDSKASSLVKSRMRLFENKFAGDQSDEIDNSSVKDSSKSAEMKFIQKVPSEEEQSSTGLENKTPEVEKVESDTTVKSSLINTENIKNHTELEQEIKETEENLSDSIILIDDDSNEEKSSIIIGDATCDKLQTENDSKNLTSETSSSVFVISDSTESETSSKPKEEYPEDLNPFDDDIPEEETSVQKVNTSLNPFGDDEDEVEENKPSPKPAVRRKIKIKKGDSVLFGKDEGTPEYLAEIRVQRISHNPFEDEDHKDSKIEHALAKPRAHTMKLVPFPRISLNPFWSDGEEPEDEEEEKHRPIPLPRNSRGSIGTPEPKPRKSGLSISSGLSAATFGSNTSLSSAQSSIGPTGRKKKQAPKPPTVMDKQDSAQSSVTSSPCASVQHSPKSTPRVRKIKKAPLPPSVTSTPFLAASDKAAINIEVSPITDDNVVLRESSGSPVTATFIPETGEWEKEKNIKDEFNRNRQSQAVASPISSSENSASLPVPNKSTYGKWKRRKGPAPSRPIPQRRNIKPLPVEEIKRELEFIEIQQQGLEKQGVRLEQIIREKCEGPHVDLESSLAPEVEDLILQLFELVNEKNELFRKQAELMYLRRQQRLEEEYADLEYQIRCLMLQPEANKTDTDKSREEELINRLVEVVERRNEIVECLEMDRVREAEEDDSINIQLNIYTAKREEDTGKSTGDDNKQKKKGKKEKKFKFKSSKKVDVDKDIDECESSGTSAPKDKEKKKKKFNIF